MMQIRKLWSTFTLIVGILLLLPFQSRAEAKETLGICLYLIRTCGMDSTLEQKLARLSGIMDSAEPSKKPVKRTKRIEIFERKYA